MRSSDGRTGASSLSADERIAAIRQHQSEAGLSNAALKRLFAGYSTLEEALGDLKLTSLAGHRLEADGTGGGQLRDSEELDWFHPEYPMRLRDLGGPPMVLYYRGDLALCRLPAIAIVGTRTSDPAATAAARQIARREALKERIVVSGLAAGIDTAAHLGACDADRPTIAVLGGPILSQPGHRAEGLRDAIECTGLFLSEQAPRRGRVTRREAVGGLIARNRLIAALADGVVVVAARVTGGAINTAEHALRLGRPVFTVDWADQRYPGNLRIMLGGGIPIAEDALDDWTW